jgi:hypothetical protein
MAKRIEDSQQNLAASLDQLNQHIVDQRQLADETELQQWDNLQTEVIEESAAVDELKITQEQMQHSLADSQKLLSSMGNLTNNSHMQAASSKLGSLGELTSVFGSLFGSSKKEASPTRQQAPVSRPAQQRTIHQARPMQPAPIRRSLPPPSRTTLPPPSRTSLPRPTSVPPTSVAQAPGLPPRSRETTSQVASLRPPIRGSVSGVPTQQQAAPPELPPRSSSASQVSPVLAQQTESRDNDNPSPLPIRPKQPPALPPRQARTIGQQSKPVPIVSSLERIEPESSSPLSLVKLGSPSSTKGSGTLRSPIPSASPIIVPTKRPTPPPKPTKFARKDSAVSSDHRPVFETAQNSSDACGPTVRQKAIQIERLLGTKTVA